MEYFGFFFRVQLPPYKSGRFELLCPNILEMSVSRGTLTSIFLMLFSMGMEHIGKALGRTVSTDRSCNEGSSLPLILAPWTVQLF